MHAVLLTNDLMVSSRVEGAASRAGLTLNSIASGEQAVDRCAATEATILLVDLSTPSLNLQSIVSRLHSATARRPFIVAFGPHVHREKLDAARGAGCDEVLSRGQFFAELEEIIQRATNSDGPQGVAGGG